MNNFRLIAMPLLLVLFLTGCVSMEHTVRPFSEQDWTKAGEVSVERRFWNLFFRPSKEMRLEILQGQAEKEARRQFGNEAVVRIEKVSGRWHPLSLALAADLFGFVEDARLVAAVYLPAPAPVEPPPAPETPEPPKEYQYRVVPQAEYDSSREYTRVNFMTREMMEKDLRVRQETGQISREDAEEQIPDLPSGGAVFVSVGRIDIDNAISKWFTFRLTKGGEEIFMKRGKEDIPFVPGGDKLWWNELTLPIRTDEEPPFELEITDRYLNKNYRFSILREELSAP